MTRTLKRILGLLGTTIRAFLFYDFLQGGVVVDALRPSDQPQEKKSLVKDIIR